MTKIQDLEQIAADIAALVERYKQVQQSGKTQGDMFLDALTALPETDRLVLHWETNEEDNSRFLCLSHYRGEGDMEKCLYFITTEIDDYEAFFRLSTNAMQKRTAIV